MKTIFLITFACLTFFSNAQIDSITKPRGNNTFGIAFENGGGVNYLDDEYTLNPLEDRTELKDHPSFGITCFYEHQFNFKRNHGLILGFGLNATFFSTHITYENPELQSSIYYNGELIYGTNTKRYDLGQQKRTYFAIDLPVLYNYTFSIKNRWNIAPYVGVKFRNVVYVSGEGRNRSTTSSSTFEGTYGEDTTYYMNHQIAGGMKNQRMVILPTIGVKASKILHNGGKLNCFVDYSYGLLGNVETYYSNFNSVEKVETANGPGNTSYEMNYFQENRTLFLVLKMSHLRAGISYTLPHK